MFQKKVYKCKKQLYHILVGGSGDKRKVKLILDELNSIYEEITNPYFYETEENIIAIENLQKTIEKDIEELRILLSLPINGTALTKTSSLLSSSSKLQKFIIEVTEEFKKTPERRLDEVYDTLKTKLEGELSMLNLTLNDKRVLNQSLEKIKKEQIKVKLERIKSKMYRQLYVYKKKLYKTLLVGGGVLELEKLSIKLKEIKTEIANNNEFHVVKINEIKTIQETIKEELEILHELMYPSSSLSNVFSNVFSKVKDYILGLFMYRNEIMTKTILDLFIKKYKEVQTKVILNPERYTEVYKDFYNYVVSMPLTSDEQKTIFRILSGTPEEDEFEDALDTPP